MMEQLIRGSHVAMVTPFTDDGEIDVPSLENLVEFLISNGVQGILASGTTGEAFSLEPDEREFLVEKVISLVRGRVIVGAMTGYVGTRISIRLAQHAQAHGADYVLIPPPPSSFPLSGRGLVSYYVQVAHAVDLPVMVYDGGGGAEVSLGAWKTILAGAENIRYAKVSVQDPPKIKTLLNELDGKIVPLAGKEETLLAMLGNGAMGMVSGTANVLPAEISAIYEAYSTGKRDQAREIFYSKANPVITMSFPARNEFIQCLKQCLFWQGVIASSATRHPLVPLDEVRVEELRAAAQFSKLALREPAGRFVSAVRF